MSQTACFLCEVYGSKAFTLSSTDAFHSAHLYIPHDPEIVLLSTQR